METLTIRKSGVFHKCKRQICCTRMKNTKPKHLDFRTWCDLTSGHVTQRSKSRAAKRSATTTAYHSPNVWNFVASLFWQHLNMQS